jgi:hypothetical protein
VNPRLRELFIVTVIALIGAFVIVRLVVRPTYTDSFYHFNAAVRLASAEGLTDEYVWTYIGQPSPAPVVPSHLYWMPFTSIITGISMAIFNAPGNYGVAQLPLIVMFAGTVIIAYTLGYKLGGTRRHAIIAALLTLMSGFFTRFWGEIDTFTPYAFVGSLCLLAMGYGAEKREWRWWVLAGLMAGFGHLTRADGLLLWMVGVMVIGVVGARHVLPLRRVNRLGMIFVVFTLAYLLVMGTWFIRMIEITGSPLPTGGLQAAWFTTYDDLFRYPPDANAGEFFGDGLGLFLETRWTAFTQNLQTFLFVEGMVVLMPLMLVGLWKKRSWFTLPMILFTLGIHVAMTFVFPFPGWRGGLFHAVSALVPFWSAFAIVGLDAIVDWIAKRRRTWQPKTAKRLFSVGIVLLAAVLSLSNTTNIRRTQEIPPTYAALRDLLPLNSRVLINDPAQFYYFTGIGGAVLPNETPQVISELAAHYEITHVVLEGVREIDGRTVSGSVPAPLQAIFENPPTFLRELPFEDRSVRVYEIIR